MRNVYVLLMACFLAIPSAIACDVCGCAAGGAWSPFPQYRANLVGIQWEHWQYHYPGFQTTDLIWQANAWARLNPWPRWQLTARLPWQQSIRHGSSLDTTISGIGDLEARIQYRLFTTPDSNTSTWRQQAWLGLGVQLPTGRQAPVEIESQLPTSFYMSTGNVALQLDALYQVRAKDWILQAQSRFQYAAYNAQGFRPGARGIANLSLYRTILLSPQSQCLPSISFQQEWLARDVQNGFYQARSGGVGSWLQLGSLVVRGPLQLNAGLGVPLHQSYAQGEIQGRWRANVSFTVQI